MNAATHARVHVSYTILSRFGSNLIDSDIPQVFYSPSIKIFWIGDPQVGIEVSSNLKSTLSGWVRSDCSRVAT